VKHAALAVDLLGNVLHEVNNSAQLLSAMDALGKHVGAEVVAERGADLAACGATLEAQGELLRAMCGDESRPAGSPRAARLLWSLVKKRLSAEQRQLSYDGEACPGRLDLALAAQVLAQARRAPAGAHLTIDFERGACAEVAS
jgi:hypothetical protein